MIGPTIDTLPEEYIDPVNISVSAFTVNALPTGVVILAEPVKVNDPVILVEPVTLKVLLL